MPHKKTVLGQPPAAVCFGLAGTGLLFTASRNNCYFGSWIPRERLKKEFRTPGPARCSPRLRIPFLEGRGDSMCLLLSLVSSLALLSLLLYHTSSVSLIKI